MKKLLIIDDDKDVRWDAITGWWRQERGLFANDIIWLVRYPMPSLIAFLQEHPEISYLSLDHDLGHTDLTVELNKEMWNNPNEYERQLSKLDIVIHSMNSVGQKAIFDKVSEVAASTKIVPLHKMIQFS